MCIHPASQYIMSIIKTERSLAYIHAPTRRCYVILTTLFAFCAQQLFFLHLEYVCVWCKRRKEKDFCSTQRAFLYASDVWMYVCVEGKKVHAFGRETTTIMWQNCAKKKKKEPCTCGHWDRMYDGDGFSSLSRTYYALSTKHHAHTHIRIYV